MVLLAWCTVHLLTGTPWSDLLAWVGAVGLGIVVPGTALVRAVRRAGAPLIEDVAWGTAAGCLVALTGWLADRTLPWSPSPFVWGPAVLVLLLVVPVTRKRVLARPEPGWGNGANLALGLIMLVVLAWMTTTCLQWLPVNPGRTGVLYSQDTLYQAGLVGELSHHLVPDYPFVAGEPLNYHWFLYAILAHLTTGTGIDPFDSSLRLGPTTVLPAVMLLAAVVARRMSGRIAAGPVAMGLLGLVDLSLANRWGWQGSSSVGGALSPVIGFWRGSPPQALGWLAGLAALGTMVAWLRRSDVDRAVPTALLLPFLIFCAGAKSSEVPVLAAGIGLALLAALIQRRWPLALRSFLLLVAGAAVFGLATVVIYRGGAYGMIFDAGEHADLQTTQLFPGLDILDGTPALALTTALLVGILPLLPRLVGLVWLGARRRADPSTWIVIGTCLGGFGATYLFRHPAQSEIYFLVSAYPLAVVGSAVGITEQFAGLARKLALSRRTLLIATGACVALGAGAAIAVAAAQPRSWPLSRWALHNPIDPLAAGVSVSTQAGWYLPSQAQLVGALALVVIVVILVAVAFGRGPAQLRAAVVPISIAALLGSGVYGMSQTIGGVDSRSLAQSMRHFTSTSAADGTLPTTQDLVDGGRWLQTHAGPNDVIATNRYCVETAGWRAGRSRCDAREFSTSALSQRRSYVGGWAYANQILSIAWTQPPPYRKIPFWDPGRQALEDQAFKTPTTAVLNTLYDAGVRWLWADVRDGPVAEAQLDSLAALRYVGPNLRVWQLPVPDEKPMSYGSIARK